MTISSIRTGWEICCKRGGRCTRYILGWGGAARLLKLGPCFRHLNPKPYLVYVIFPKKIRCLKKVITLIPCWRQIPRKPHPDWHTSSLGPYKVVPPPLPGFAVGRNKIWVWARYKVYVHDDDDDDDTDDDVTQVTSWLRQDSGKQTGLAENLRLHSSA